MTEAIRQAAQTAIANIAEAVKVNDSDTLSMMTSDDHEIWCATGSWSPMRKVTLGDLRAIAALAQSSTPPASKGGPDSLATAKARLSIATVKARNSGAPKVEVIADDVAVLIAAHSDQDRQLSSPASKGVKERTDADLLRLIAKDHARLAPNAHHGAETLRQIADRLDAPTPSDDTLQGRGATEGQYERAFRELFDEISWVQGARDLPVGSLGLSIGRVLTRLVYDTHSQYRERIEAHWAAIITKRKDKTNG